MVCCCCRCTGCCCRLVTVVPSVVRSSFSVSVCVSDFTWCVFVCYCHHTVANLMFFLSFLFLLLLLLRFSFVFSSPSLSAVCTHGRFQYKKYRLAEFGRCPRTMCKNQPVVPVRTFNVDPSRAEPVSWKTPTWNWCGMFVGGGVCVLLFPPIYIQHRTHAIYGRGALRVCSEAPNHLRNSTPPPKKRFWGKTKSARTVPVEQ